MTLILIRVTYSHEWQSWGVTQYDRDDNQIGEESDWFHHQRDAIAEADRLAGRHVRIELYYRDGGFRSSRFGKRKGYE